MYSEYTMTCFVSSLKNLQIPCYQLNNVIALCLFLILFLRSPYDKYSENDMQPKTQLTVTERQLKLRHKLTLCSTSLNFPITMAT